MKGNCIFMFNAQCNSVHAKELLAHTAKGKNDQFLMEHLENVAKTCKIFSSEFGAGDIGEVVGILYDIGKATKKFQDYLKDNSGESIKHKFHGAQIVNKTYPHIGKLLAYVIGGHHTAIPDDFTDNLNEALTLDMLKPELDKLLCDIPILPHENDLLTNLRCYAKLTEIQAFYMTMLIRMLHSSLVDADYLDTEKFMDEDRFNKRSQPKSLIELDKLFQIKLEELRNFPQDSIVNISRHIVLENCLKASENKNGLFSLTVPTGGGKTLSSLAFALKHAKKNGMKRIIYAIPFTTITEQNANVFKEVLGQENVLEHHSNIDSDNETIEARLATENWDASLIVTTNIQLLESLFSAKPSKARKNHNIANSVIILDEAQTLPDQLLKPTLAALTTLAESFNSSVVFCTATQPSLKAEWLDGIKPIEIIEDTALLFNNLNRVIIRKLGEVSKERLVDMLLNDEQALCIVNTRKHARQIYESLPKQEDIFHLSALMVPVHRMKVIKTIKERLAMHKPCIVISTQLIEAGVDIDFPIVYRAMAGIDSIAQAAGRCNREGKLKKGIVNLFNSEEALLSGHFQSMSTYASEVMDEYSNPLLPEAISKFFDLRYALGNNLDKPSILKNIADGSEKFSFQFREIDKAYKIINNTTVGIVVPYDEIAEKLIEDFYKEDFKRDILRKLQRYTVSVYANALEELINVNAVISLKDKLYVLDVSNENFNNFYDNDLGLICDGKYAPDFV